MSASTAKPVTSAIAAFATRMPAICSTGMCSATSMGSISSEVLRNTATSVPSVTTRPA